MDPILTLADKSTVILPIINSSNTAEFQTVDSILKDAPNVLQVDIENGTVPEIIYDINTQIKNIPLNKVVVLKDKEEPDDRIDEIIPFLEEKGKITSLSFLTFLQADIVEILSSDELPTKDLTGTSLILPISSEQSPTIVTDAKDVSIKTQKPVVPIFTDDFIEPIVEPVISKDIESLKLDEIKRAVECSAVLEPGRMDNLKEKIILLLPRDLRMAAVLDLLAEINDLHPEQKVILAHLGEIYRIKNGPNFISETKHVLQVQLPTTLNILTMILARVKTRAVLPAQRQSRGSR